VTTIQVRRGTAAQWVSAATVLAAGELGLDTTNNILKLGDGSTAWASLSVVNNHTYAVLGQVTPGLTVNNPYGLRRWWAALAGAYFAQAVVNVYGDSVSVGAGSDGLSGANDPSADATYRARGWVSQLGSLFATTYGTINAGPGTITGVDPGARVVLAAGASISRATGAWEGGIKLQGGNSNTATYTLAACTEIDIYAWDGGKGTFRYAVDGGSTTTVGAYTNDGANNYTYNKTTITGLANTTHTLVITSSVTAGATGDNYIAAVVPRLTTTGVLVNRIARSGYTSQVLVGQDSNLSGLSADVRSRLIAAETKAPVPHLAVLAMGTNDFKLQNSTDVSSTAIPGSTPTTFKANLTTFATQVIANGGCVLLLGEPRREATDYPSPVTYTEQQYIDAMRSLAQATDHVAFMDMGDLFGNNASGQALGFQYSSGAGGGWSVHPTLAGHGAIAHAVHAVLRQPLGASAPTS
jgi:hypothetical protein